MRRPRNRHSRHPSWYVLDRVKVKRNARCWAAMATILIALVNIPVFCPAPQMQTNIFEKKYAEALVCEDTTQGNKPIGMAIVSNDECVQCFSQLMPAATPHATFALYAVLLQLLDMDGAGEPEW